MIEKPNFEGNVSLEGEKAPYRRMGEDQEKKIADLKLKNSDARWAALATKKTTDAAVSNG